MIKLKNPATTTPARSRIKDQFFVFSMLFFGGVSLFTVLTNLLLARFERAYEEERTANLQKTRELEHLSMTDHLTGLFNRLMLEEAFIQAKGSYTRTGNAFSLLLIDIDHFKAYNDSLGHAAGDRCLQTVTSTIQSCLERDTDTAFRYGGEEFLVLLPYTYPPGSLKVAERIRRRIEALQVYHPDTSGEAILTVSIGTTTARPGKTDQDTLFQEVDAAMYTAKASGRNRVIQYHNL